MKDLKYWGTIMLAGFFSALVAIIIMENIHKEDPVTTEKIAIGPFTDEDFADAPKGEDLQVTEEPEVFIVNPDDEIPGQHSRWWGEDQERYEAELAGEDVEQWKDANGMTMDEREKWFTDVIKNVTIVDDTIVSIEHDEINKTPDYVIETPKDMSFMTKYTGEDNEGRVLYYVLDYYNMKWLVTYDFPKHFAYDIDLATWLPMYEYCGSSGTVDGYDGQVALTPPRIWD